MDGGDYIVSLIEKTPIESTVLDLGCIGDNLAYCAKRDSLHKRLVATKREVIGVDLDKEGITYLNERGFTILYEDVQDFDLGRTYDYIVAGNLIEHLPNADGFISSLLVHMHDNTQIIISTPNAYCIHNFLGILLTGKRKINPGHVLRHSLETLEIVFSMYDLQIVHHKFTNDLYTGSIVNKFMVGLTKFMSFFRPAFSSSIIVVLQKKQIK